MLNLVRIKWGMRKYARRHGIEEKPRMVMLPVWGRAAKKLAWRIAKQSKLDYQPKPWPELIGLLFPATKPKIIDPHLQYRTLYHRDGNPPGVVWHNSGSSGGTIEGIHAYHLSLGWAGCAYHFVIYKDGRIFQGRPEWAMGGHCLGHNDWLGVCCIGNYESSDHVMPEAQLAAAQALHTYLHRKYSGLPDKRHRDMPGNSTACPGKYYPFDRIVSLK